MKSISKKHIKDDIVSSKDRNENHLHRNKEAYCCILLCLILIGILIYISFTFGQHNWGRINSDG